MAGQKNGLIVDEHGTKKWFINGELHREDEWRGFRFAKSPSHELRGNGDCFAIPCPYGPAIEYSDGSKFWYRNGQLHRKDGPAIEFADGGKEWWFNGQLHRENGPAIECYSGTKEWWFNGQRHREDGPAMEWANGTTEWWLEGKRVEQFTHFTKSDTFGQ